MSRSPENPIPYAELETLFLDVGNTLISVDFGWIAEELAKTGLACEPEVLRRAEAAARPAVSARIGQQASTEGLDAFTFYIRTVLGNLVRSEDVDSERLDSLARELVPVLRTPRPATRLWSWVMPGVPEALDSLRALGLRLVVVSNSDGTVENLLGERGLRHHFEAVHDSHRVGFEKPDPRFFRHALESCGGDPERTLHAGDLYHADVLGAWGAGVHAVLLDPFDDWTDMDCERVPDLATLVARIRGARERPAPER